VRAARFFTDLRRENTLRSRAQRNLRTDLALHSRNLALRPLELALIARYYSEQYPVAFVTGAPRSGTTLLYQLLVRHVDLGYVCNRAARYWLAPVYGTARALGSKRGTYLEDDHRSDLGRTEGDYAPHEFTYFFRYWSKGTALTTDDEEVDQVEWRAIRRELGALAGYFGSPVVLKSLDFSSYRIEKIHRHLPTARFIHIERDPICVVQSILEARVKQYGSESVWWSVRPRDHARWAELPAIEQVCRQVRDITGAIDSALANVPTDRVHRVTYAELIADPANVVRSLAGFLGAQLREPSGLDSLRLEDRNRNRVAPPRRDAIERVFAGI